MLLRKRITRLAARAATLSLTFAALLALTLTVQAQPTPTPTPTPSAPSEGILLRKYINTYVSVMDPDIVEDVFGKRISDRFVVIQVTISNKNSSFQFLIHDVSLDLRQVFGRQVRENLAAEAEDFGEDMNFELSSLELSLIRGVAEKGQAQDKRNKLLRYLEGIGTIGAGLVGIAGFGRSYADAMAMYNGEFLAAYRHVYPDFTINQMNRLSDSAYKSNTLIPKEQAKVIVAFIPQAIFLTPDQRKAFRKAPTSLYPNLNVANAVSSTVVDCGNGKQCNPVDFRKTVALVDGRFVVELQNLPLTLTGVQISPDQALGFLRAQPVVKGYIVGQFMEGANISLVNPPAGVQIAPDASATPEDGKIFFLITANAPIPSGTNLNLRVFNSQNAQTFMQPVSYTIPVPTLDTPENEPEGTVGGPDVDITLDGKNLMSDGVTALAIEPGSGIKITNIKVEERNDGTGTVTATLKMAQAIEGAWNLRAVNGKTVFSNPLRVRVKKP